MQVSEPNNVKIYDLTTGKSLPHWLSDRKKRSLLKKDIDLRRRIQLLQDFEMPDLTDTIRLSGDGRYVIATGLYKPRVRCFEVDNLSMKFERCMDSEVVTFEILSDDYSKLVFLESDRWLEFHAAGGVYHRLRIPRYGRDIKLHPSSADLYIAAAGREVYRFNLERGQFLEPILLEEGTSEATRLAVSPVHGLICVGTKEGKVVGVDPRCRRALSPSLDVLYGTLSSSESGLNEEQQSPVNHSTTRPGSTVLSSVSSLGFDSALGLSVGTSTGQILVYDLRSKSPLLVKDHMYGLPIRDLAFHEDWVLSMDRAVLKIWEKNTGKLFTAIDSSGAGFNSLCHVPNSGLLFMATESPKIATYYIPSLGRAPRWCSFLDSLTEELEESRSETVYDDYKFVTEKELESLGLEHLKGSSLLRGYMHGYFLNLRLYNRAKAASQSFLYSEYKKKKIREEIEEDRKSRVLIKELPPVNRELARRLMESSGVSSTSTKNFKNSSQESSSLLTDPRFSRLFRDPHFEVDPTTQEYRLLHPVISKLDRGRQAKVAAAAAKKTGAAGTVVEEVEITGAGDSSEESDSEQSKWTGQLKAAHRLLRTEEERERRRLLQRRGGREVSEETSLGESLEERLMRSEEGGVSGRGQDGEVRRLKSGEREMTFTPAESGKKKKSDKMGMKRRTGRPPPTSFSLPGRRGGRRRH